MNNKARGGKSSELMVASLLTRNSIDVYFPIVDDIAIDMIIRTESIYYDIQVKSVKNYNRIVGVKELHSKNKNYIIIIHYRHDKKNDEFFYLTLKQAKDQWKEKNKNGDINKWGDLIFNKEHREKFSTQNLEDLASKILLGKLKT